MINLAATPYTLHDVLCVFLGIRFMVKNIPQLDRKEMKSLDAKLERCLNQDNNPESEE